MLQSRSERNECAIVRFMQCVGLNTLTKVEREISEY